MTTDLIILDATLDRLPALISHSGEHAASACLEFFTAHIRNPNTRRAYARTLSDFSDWCSQHSLDLKSLKPVHVAAYIEQMTKEYEKDFSTSRLSPWMSMFGESESP